MLKPGGYFLYSDLFSAELLDKGTACFEACGFVVERNQDITPNVLRSCDEIAQNRASAYTAASESEAMREFLAVPGSDVYERMRTRQWTYRILKLRRGHRVSGAAGKRLSSELQAGRSLA